VCDVLFGPALRASRRFAAVLLFFGLFLGPSRQVLAACSGLGPCIDANSLWLPAGHGEFLALPDTRVDAPGQLSFGFAAELMRGPVTAHVSSPDAAGRDVHIVDYANDASLSLSLGVLDRLELFGTLPARVYQNGAGAGGLASQSAPSITSTALRDPRLGFAYSFDNLLRLRELGARAALEASFPFGDRAAFAGDRNVVLQPSVTFSYRAERFSTRGELGARLRESSDYGDLRVGSQGFIALAAGVDVLSRGLLFASAEAFALPPLGSNRAPGASATVTTVRLVPAEWLVALSTTFRPHGEWQLAASLGTGLPLSGETRSGASADYLGITTPLWRSVLSLRFEPR